MTKDIDRKALEQQLRALGWEPVEYDLLGGDYWHRPPHGLHVPLVNYRTNKAKLSAIRKETKRQDAEVSKP